MRLSEVLSLIVEWRIPLLGGLGVGLGVNRFPYFSSQMRSNGLILVLCKNIFLPNRLNLFFYLSVVALTLSYRIYQKPGKCY